MNRTGAALVLALLILLVLEGVVAGTVYLTVQERRLADNGIVTLRLRLAAEAAARRAAGEWPAALDTLAPGGLAQSTVTNNEGLVVRTVYQRVDRELFVVFAEAAEPPPRAGRARASLLIRPPVLPRKVLPAAAVTAGGTVTLGPAALVSATSDTRCPADTAGGGPDAVRLPDEQLLVRAPAAALEGVIRSVSLASGWGGWIAGAATALEAESDSLMSAFAVAVLGDLTIAANASVRGLILVDGALVVEAGAVIEGVVVATGPIDLQGTIRFSSCAAGETLRATGLDRPRPYGPRPSLPAL